MYQNGASDSPPSLLVVRPGDRHVIADDGHADIPPILAEFLGRRRELLHVLYKILHDEERSPLVGGCPDDADDFRRGRGHEEVAHDGARQHTFTHVTPVRRVVATTTAAKNRHRRIGKGVVDEAVRTGHRR